MTDDVIPSALDVLTGPVPALSQPRDPADGAARVHARSRRALVSLSTLPSHVGGRDAAAGPSARARRIARLQLASSQGASLSSDYTPAMAARVKAGFIEPMLLLRTDDLPDDPTRWEYQLKFDGYRTIAF